MTEYLVIYEQGADGAWGAYSPDLPGCVAAGSSRADVEALMREAVPMYVEELRAAGSAPPVPLHAAGTVAA